MAGVGGPLELAARYGGLELCHNDAVNLGNWGLVTWLGLDLFKVPH